MFIHLVLSRKFTSPHPCHSSWRFHNGLSEGGRMGLSCRRCKRRQRRWKGCRNKHKPSQVPYDRLRVGHLGPFSSPSDDFWTLRLFYWLTLVLVLRHMLREHFCVNLRSILMAPFQKQKGFRSPSGIAWTKLTTQNLPDFQRYVEYPNPLTTQTFNDPYVV